MSNKQEAPVQVIQIFVTPDGERHGSHDAAMQHYREAILGSEVTRWVEEHCDLPNHVVQKGVIDAINDDWRNLLRILSRRVELEGEAGEVPESMLHLLDKPLRSLKLAVRVENALFHADVKHVGAVVTKSEADLLEIKKFGRTGLYELKTALAAHGLSIGMEAPEWLPPPPEDDDATNGDED
jgi:DNA-directed RNA polymerase subunit alpha